MNKKSVAIVMLTGLAGAVLAATSWKTEPTQSKLTFVGIQAGAEFVGAFQQFTADIQFDPMDLATSRFKVSIDVKSVNSKDKERDDIIRGVDLFAVKRWPTAQYVTDKFTDQGGGKFTGLGKLTIRDITRDVPINFTYETDANGAWLKGQAKLKRLDFGVGQGEWKDTQWVSNDVRVEFALRLQH
jgi:polyisoprenoid-binding protein YceI